MFVNIPIARGPGHHIICCHSCERDNTTNGESLSLSLPPSLPPLTLTNMSSFNQDNFRKVMEVRKKLVGDTGDTLITPYRVSPGRTAIK